MEDATLKKYFDDFTEKIDGLKSDIKDIDDWQRSQYKKVIILEEHQKASKEDMKNHKTNVRWGVTIIMPTVTASLIFIANFFIPKSG